VKHVDVGELRRSQAVFSFGIGAPVDLPHISAIMLGTQHWAMDGWNPLHANNAISEPRLLRMAKLLAGSQVKQLVSPPVRYDENARYGIPVALFPRWLRCSRCEMIAPPEYGVFHLSEDQYRADRTKFVHRNCPKMVKGDPTVHPVRFVVACNRGHLADFPWERYIKQVGNCTCTGKSLLHLQERGVSAEVADLWLRCAGCDKALPLTRAFEQNEVTQAYDNIGDCPKCHPHLSVDGAFRLQGDSDPCRLRPMLLGASNQWFPMQISALTLPSGDGRLAGIIDRELPRLRDCPPAVLEWNLKQGMFPALLGFPFADIEAEIAKQVAVLEGPPASRVSELKDEEWAAFRSGTDGPQTPDFQVAKVDVPPAFQLQIAEVLQVKRLRVVRALTAFTRVDSPGDYSDLSEVAEPSRAPLSIEPPTWLPAAEVRGEGIFICLKEEAIDAWRADTAVRARETQLRSAYVAFRRSRAITPDDDGVDLLRFALIHTFSHLLLREFAIDCGYSSASMQERIYSRGPDEPGGPMAGVLIMTASPDSEGTLGGLVRLAEPSILNRLIKRSLERASFCSSDPLCAEHLPHADGRTLHAAACHSCLFVSETSCERSNRLLDRSLLVPTCMEHMPPFFGT
jgi:hypothetical protein